ncbi:MAG TPA: 50S ribosomal protein L25 [Halieaceae bacterium]|jgi:large subunit ribosomal protein L25|uniref:50S ribosomal protein L25/general stress protein Ctc n=1 Tax=Haliea TaxID=475794 RepID=UPI0004033959|nr:MULTISPECIES: 50S ribosomal protein L25/general stress protein Ctc [Haliea]HBQ39547.1 50S ribosomal protein L25 [Halieaceae bacterium]MAY93842.1 50S ribosomal protein L25 [Haliea sp.]MBK41601.1 50S ribosomal protein L25 [Haliea sp.]MBP70864.1 50S ribosomal protein L25 [Haliea sp.]HCD54541.1 50S ribosomal protein L25 [Halieaceae bacterium]|tara:strand:- start:15276 stop:15923 length:648 start_codon:yes stop_codon:yes gene_type:complete
MSDQFELYAEVREDMGKGASRRLRRLADQVPAIIYGGDKDPQPLSIIRKDLEKSLENEAFFSHVLVININGKKEKAILKDLQRHPARNSVTHADFMRVSEKVAIKVHVPIHFLNEKTCHGVKVQGGMIQHQATDIEVLCLPSDIPEFIEVDMAEVKTGDIIHLSDIALPAGVTSVALSLGEDHDLAVASVVAPKGGSDAEEDSSEDSSSDSSSED